MRVVLAGATGVLGRRLLPLLLEAGHEVVATTRSPDKIAALEAAGAKAVVMDGLDAYAVTAAIELSQPEAVIHELTALGPPVET